jgi:hypothetical protein
MDTPAGAVANSGYEAGTTKAAPAGSVQAAEQPVNHQLSNCPLRISQEVVHQTRTRVLRRGKHQYTPLERRIQLPSQRPKGGY